MRNPIKIIRKMSREWVSDKDLKDFEFQNLEKIIRNVGLVHKEVMQGGRIFHKVQGIQAKTFFLSGKEEQCKFASISDLHGGFNSININALSNFLERAKNAGVKYCCISGDTHEGICIFPGQKYLLKESQPEKQAQIIFDVLKKFNFTYIIIDGNHDLSFDIRGLPNPNEILARKLQEKGIKAHYLYTFVANVIIGGACIRLVHLDDHYGKGENVACLKYNKKVIEHPFVEYNHNTYLVAAIQAGHVHKHAYYDIVKFDYNGKNVRERTKKEIKNIQKQGYKPLLVIQPGSIKNHIIKPTTEIGFVTSISLDEHGNPCSYEIY